MKRKFVAATATLIIGLSFYALEATADELDDVGTSGSMDIVETASDAEEANGLLYEEIPEFGNARTVSLQIPQKLQIVIDPFEMDGKGQIYSEQYMVRNMGETAGALTLAFVCRLGGDGVQEVWPGKGWDT